MTKNRLRRWLDHGLMTPVAVRRAFARSTLTAIGRAIGEAEQGHSGEIRFVIEGALPWHLLRGNSPVRHRAIALFSNLRVWDTEHNNGVLVYVELADRAVEVIADRGIARLVPERDWDRICLQLRESFAAGRYESGAIEAVRAVGALLQAHFPLQPGERRVNELPDRPIRM